MALLALFKDLWRDVIWRATQSCPADGLHVPSGDQQGCETEIANLDIHVPVEKDVSHLEIPVDYALRVHVFNGARDLDSIEAHLRFRQALSPLNHVHQRSIRAEL